MGQIKSGATSDLMTVDPVSKAARVTAYSPAGNSAVLDALDQPATAAGQVVLGVNDRSAMPLRLDRMGSLASALHIPLLHDSFEGGTVHALRWNPIATTMAATQSSVAGLTINSGAITTVSTGYMLQSLRRFMKAQRSPLQSKFRSRMIRVNNSVQEFGFGDATTATGVHTTGAFWQVTSGGAVQPVVMYNGSDLSAGPVDISSLLDNARYYTWDVMVDDDEAIFVCQDTSTGLILSRQSLKLPVTAQRLFSSSQLPVFARVFNTGVAPVSAPQMLLTDVYVMGLDADQNKPWPHVMAALGRGATENPFTGAQLQTWANSAEPANATLSNTAAGYATLGGKFQFAAPVGAVTDFALFGFQVPAPANMMITGVDIEAWNLGAAVATTPTLLTWALAYGAAAVTLASGTWSRVGLGVQAFPVGAAIGATAPRLSKAFQTPIPVASGRFINVILRIPVGTATASQVIAGMVNFEGYFE